MAPACALSSCKIPRAALETALPKAASAHPAFRPLMIRLLCIGLLTVGSRVPSSTTTRLVIKRTGKAGALVSLVKDKCRAFPGSWQQSVRRTRRGFPCFLEISREARQLLVLVGNSLGN
ncbi:hypothetical protein BHM03_00037782 [Ensete ventricosum]|nr:hypothetical protein BHM03_00037782 [Ensete ventricosum]